LPFSYLYQLSTILEQHRETLMVDDEHLKMFRDRGPRRPHYLERSRRKAGRLVAAWNLIVPEEVYSRSWEEAKLSDATRFLNGKQTPLLPHK